MNSISIIVLVSISILLFSSFFIVKVHLKESRLTNDRDFISDLVLRLSKHIARLGISFKTEWYFLILGTAPPILGGLLYAFTRSAPAALLAGGGALFLPEGVIQSIHRAQSKKFEERYARSLEQLSSSLRAGMSISQAVEDTANCKFLHQSMRVKYAKLSSDLQMGLTVCEAFHRFAEGTNSEDASDVALAIDIQNEVGGHEADVIKEIANNIHARILLRREIKSIFSSNSSMVWIMDFLVPIVFIGYAAMSPGNIEVYFSNPIYTMIFVLFLMMIVTGSIINHRTMRNIQKGA